MYVEYLGIPGCGKTFWKDRHIEQIRAEGIPYLDVSRQKVMPFWLKVFYKIAEMFLLQLPKYKRQIRECEEVCKGCLKKPKYLPFSLAHCIKDIVMASLLHDIFEGKKIYVNDEGQLQRVVSLVVQYGVPLERLLPWYLKYRGEATTIYVKTDVETAFVNIRKRNRHVCPMDELKDDALIAYETEFFECCELLAKEIKFNFDLKKICPKL